MLHFQPFHKGVCQTGIEVYLQGDRHGDQQHMEEAARNVVGLKGEYKDQSCEQRGNRHRREFRQQNPFKPCLPVLANQQGPQDYTCRKAIPTS